jgi:tetratricopeptide (TPR) repeat protein
MFRRSVPIVAFALALTAGPSAAQPSGPGGTAVTRATIESSSGYRQYTDPAIQADLKLTDEQKARIAKIPDDLLAKHKDAIEKEQAARKEAADRSAALQADLQTKVEALLDRHLTAAQRKRFGQLVVRSMGMAVFADPDVVKALALTDSQKARFAELRRDGLEKLIQLQADGAFGDPTDAASREKRLEASRKMAQETISRFVETFTTEQKKGWTELAGEPSEVATAATPAMAGVPPLLLRNFGLSPAFALNTRFARQVALLQNEKALAELKLEKSAGAALAAGWKAIQEDARRAAGAGPGVGPFGVGGRSLPIQFAIQSEATQLASQVLTEPQKKRLEQIQLQLNGLSGLVGFSASSDVLGKLTLTPAQAARIDAVIADVAQQIRGLRRRPVLRSPIAPTPETEQQAKARAEYARKVREIEQKALADVVATFDAGQKAAWKELTGEPFDVFKATESETSALGFPRFGGRNTTVSSVWANQASSRQFGGQYAAALAAIDEAIRLAPNVPLYQLQKASLLATCPADLVRDGKAAVEIARKAIEQTNQPSSGDYAVLAAAYAEAGRFDEAVRAQEKAIAALPPPPAASPENAGFVGGPGGFNRTATLKPQFEARLRLYQERKPYRVESPRAQPQADR